MYQICLLMPSGHKIIFSGQGYENKRAAERMAIVYSITYMAHGGIWKVCQAIAPARATKAA
jgi:hypothetical protein